MLSPNWAVQLFDTKKWPTYWKLPLGEEAKQKRQPAEADLQAKRSDVGAFFCSSLASANSYP